MKKYLILAGSLALFTACGLKDQTDQLQALEKCSYEIVSADSIYIAGTDVSKLISSEGLNLYHAPQLAFAYLQQKVPVKGVLQLRITNSGTEEAGINQFEYSIFIKDTELLSGFIDKKITVAPNGGMSTVPIKIDKEVYPLLSNPDNQKAVNDFLTSTIEKSFIVTFKIKPSLLIGEKTIKYPDYITIDKEVTNTKLLEYLKSNR